MEFIIPSPSYTCIYRKNGEHGGVCCHKDNKGSMFYIGFGLNYPMCLEKDCPLKKMQNKQLT